MRKETRFNSRKRLGSETNDCDWRGIMMKIIKVKDYEQLSNTAAKFIIERVKNKPNIVLGLATGGTPEGTYKNVIQDHQQNGTSYEQVATFNLDEYIGLPGSDKNSYRYYMNEHLFNHINVKKENTHIPNGEVSNVNQECEDYEGRIQQIGGIDLQILGIGENGHIGFNEPGTAFNSRTHVIGLTEETRQANARYFSSIESVPTHAITMGIGTIMEAKEIVLLASGEKKREAMKKLILGEVTEEFPASILQKHKNVTIIADEAALSDVQLSGDGKLDH